MSSEMNNLESMLQELFEDTEESLEDMIILNPKALPSEMFGCCTYNYTGYGG